MNLTTTFINFVIRKLSLTLDIREEGRVLNVLSRLARTPGGGSKTKTRPARSRFTGSCDTIHNANLTISHFIQSYTTTLF